MDLANWDNKDSANDQWLDSGTPFNVIGEWSGEVGRGGQL